MKQIVAKTNMANEYGTKTKIKTNTKYKTINRNKYNEITHLLYKQFVVVVVFIVGQRRVVAE